MSGIVLRRTYVTFAEQLPEWVSSHVINIDGLTSAEKIRARRLPAPDVDQNFWFVKISIQVTVPACAVGERQRQNCLLQW
jgi:hypothetical protein